MRHNESGAREEEGMGWFSACLWQEGDLVPDVMPISQIADASEVAWNARKTIMYVLPSRK